MLGNSMEFKQVPGCADTCQVVSINARHAKTCHVLRHDEMCHVLGYANMCQGVSGDKREYQVEMKRSEHI